MVNFKMEKEMYDKFIDSEVLTTQELLSIGFTNKDLTRLVEAGKIRRVSRGQYDLPVVDGLYTYCKILFGKKSRNYDRANKGMDRCIEIDPNNGSVRSSMLMRATYNKDWDMVFECLDVLDQTDNMYYKIDNDYWLYLLSFITDIPEKYRDRVKKLQYSDVIVYPDDLRYGNIGLENDIRHAVMSHEIAKARGLANALEHKNLAQLISINLINAAYGMDRKHTSELFSLIENKEYEEILKIFENKKELPGLDYSELMMYSLVKNLVLVSRKKIIPLVTHGSRSFEDAINNNDYVKAVELSSDYREKIGRNSNILLDKLLESILLEIETVKAENRDLGKLYTKITSLLMRQDVDGTFEVLDEYLGKINKNEYKGLIVDLIKLSLIDNDMAFVEPMLVLSELNKGDFSYEPSMYIYQFYYNLAYKNYKKAAIYLDMVSMSSDIGDISIDTTDMRNALVQAIKKAGLEEEALAVSMPKPKEVVEEKKLVVEEKNDVIFSLIDVVSSVAEGRPVAMLEPMNDEDIKFVSDIVQPISNVTSIVVEDDCEKRIVLRNVNKYSEYVPVADTIRGAKDAYNMGHYQDCIILFESILPNLNEPKSFIYAKLGMAYYKMSLNNVNEAIDYLTLATAQSKKENNIKYDFTDLIGKLKRLSGYDGIKVNLSTTDALEKAGSVQFLKKN